MKRNGNCKKSVRQSLSDAGWVTPDTYANDFEVFPEGPGVYLILLTDLRDWREQIAYVGQSTNLARRHRSHEVVRELRDHLAPQIFVCRLFKHCAAVELRQAERALIRDFNPPLNIIGHSRGATIGQ